MRPGSPGPSGKTLPEVLVASAVLSLVFLLTVGVYRSSLFAQRHRDAGSEAYRRAVLAARQVQRELRGARLEGPSQVGGGWEPELRFRPPLFADGRPVFRDGGQLTWDEPRTLAFEDGRLLVGDRLLADVGVGEVAFRRPGVRLVEVRVRVDLDRPGGTHELTFLVDLPNQP